MLIVKVKVTDKKSHFFLSTFNSLFTNTYIVYWGTLTCSYFALKITTETFFSPNEEQTIKFYHVKNIKPFFLYHLSNIFCKVKKWKLTNIMEKLCWYISFFHTEKIIIMGILIINPLLLPSLPLMELFIFNKILMSSVFLNQKQLFLNVALSTKFVSLSMWIKMWELDKMRRKTFFAFFFIKRKFFFEYK